MGRGSGRCACGPGGLREGVARGHSALSSRPRRKRPNYIIIFVVYHGPRSDLALFSKPFRKNSDGPACDLVCRDRKIACGMAVLPTFCQPLLTARGTAVLPTFRGPSFPHSRTFFLWPSSFLNCNSLISLASTMDLAPTSHYSANRSEKFRVVQPVTSSAATFRSACRDL